MAKKKPINWELVELYLRSGCAQKKIAESLHIHRETLSKRIKEKYGIDYTTFSTGLHSEGEMLLEAAQFQKALKSSSPGNTQMLIWLGKVRLGQREPELLNALAANQTHIDQSHLIMRLQHEIEELKNGNESKAE